MSAILHLGSTAIGLKDDEFGNGYQVGYLHFKVDFQDKCITDELLYTIIMQNITNVRRTDRCNAGYLAGFLCAMMEQRPAPLLTLVPRTLSQAQTQVSQ